MEEETEHGSGAAPGSSTTVAAGTTWCYLCGKRVGTSNRSCTNIFSTPGSSQNSVSEKIGSILQSDVTEEVVPSQVICKSCHKSVSAIDEMEAQLRAMREQVVSRHRKTVKLLQHGELPPDGPLITSVASVAAVEPEEIVAATPHSSRKTRHSLRKDPTEEQAMVVFEVDPLQPEVDSKTPLKKRRGRPPKKSIPVVEEEVIEEEEQPPQVAVEEKNLMLQDNKSNGGDPPLEEFLSDLDEPDEEVLHDDTDPEFVPEDEEEEFLPNKTSKVSKTPKLKLSPEKSKRRRKRGGEGKSSSSPKVTKKRGRPRISFEPQVELIEEDINEDLSAMDVEADPDDPDAVFSCSACDSRFVVAGALIAHLSNKHGITIHMCDLCGLDFEQKEGLVEHMASVHPPDEMEEEEEEEETPEEQPEFNEELDAEGDFQCEICNKLFSTLRTLKEHKRSHYGRNFKCKICPKRFTSRAVLEEHENSHTGNRPFLCGNCNKTFASKYCLKVHMKTHQVRPRPHVCEICGKTFMKVEHLNQHSRTHAVKRDHICKTCGKAFVSARNLEVHAIIHTGYKPFVCRICGKAFTRRAEINDHERTHTGERPFQCETCGATFSQRSNLQSHKRATHMNDRRFVCGQCGKSFKRRRLLDYHTRSVHTGERPYSCTECNATFVYPEHFKKHRRIHSGEKPFRCEVCGKAFNSRDNRNAHRFIHSNKKPYECLVCGFGFMRKPLLYAHMQSQGHVHDTIVVNQPQVPQTSSNIVSEAAAEAGISPEKVYVASADDPEPEHVEEVEHILIETPVEFATEAEPGVVEVEGGERAHTIFVPVSSAEGGGQSVQLVQIRLQGTGDEAQWIKLTAP